MHAASSLRGQHKTTVKLRKKKKKRAPTPSLLQRKKKGLVLPAAIRSGSEVAAVGNFVTQVDPTLYIVSNSVLPQV